MYMFGVTLYELESGGAEPWAGLTVMEAARRVMDGRTLTVPPGAAPRLREVMARCWASDAGARPSMSEVYAVLAALAVAAGEGGGGVAEAVAAGAGGPGAQDYAPTLAAKGEAAVGAAVSGIAHHGGLLS